MPTDFNPLAALRDADWLDALRARSYRWVLIGVTLVAFAAMLATSRHGIDRYGRPLGTDFIAFWSAARLAIAGTPAAAYDLARLYAMERRSLTADPGLSSFLYPPPFLLACLPFGLLPYFCALPVWIAATGAAYALAMRRWLGAHRGALLTLLAFPAVISNIGHGQNGFLTAALLAGGLGLLDRRPWLAGVLLGCLVIKPQLAFAVPVLVLAGGRWRTGVAGVATVVLLSLLSLAAFGPGVWHGFLVDGPVGRAILEQGLVQPGKMVSMFAAVETLHGGVALGYALQALISVAAAALLVLACRRARVPGGPAALAAAATLVMSPYLFDYDLPSAAIPLAWLLSEGLRRGFRPWEKLVLVAGYMLPLYARNLAMGVGLPVAPLVLGALTWMTARAALDHRHAAVDMQRLPGDVPGLA